MKLTDILTANCIRVPLEAADKTGTITELVDVLADQGLLADRDLVLQAILDRERTASTGIGQGLAVPHGKSSGCDRLVMALGKPAEPLDFDSKDGKPVEIVVLLASPPQKTGPHIQALARISRLMMMESFRQGVKAADSAGALWDVVCEHEQ
ncbi:MAG: PTS sugar transporter subunit IIA [Phycisphaerae bacterium]